MSNFGKEASLEINGNKISGVYDLKIDHADPTDVHRAPRNVDPKISPMEFAATYFFDPDSPAVNSSLFSRYMETTSQSLRGTIDALGTAAYRIKKTRVDLVSMMIFALQFRYEKRIVLSDLIYVRYWRFPKSPWIEYEKSDESWARNLGYGRWDIRPAAIMTNDAIYIHTALLLLDAEKRIAEDIETYRYPDVMGWLHHQALRLDCNGADGEIFVSMRPTDYIVF